MRSGLENEIFIDVEETEEVRGHFGRQARTATRENAFTRTSKTLRHFTQGLILIQFGRMCPHNVAHIE
jgi:hypothetical protein